MIDVTLALIYVASTGAVWHMRGALKLDPPGTGVKRLGSATVHFLLDDSGRDAAIDAQGRAVGRGLEWACDIGNSDALWPAAGFVDTRLS
ncbi:hypothetical protein ABLE91_28535 [Aquabacter sp. CN5-332]|uniref:hypothetical protein n=1 Tax=Aquabacter sp. CN5-332 TaxID=3156608 RepID=UPI0032B40D49